MNGIIVLSNVTGKSHQIHIENFALLLRLPAIGRAISIGAKMGTKRYSFGWKKNRRILNKNGGNCFYCGCKLPEDTQITEGGLVLMSIRNWDIDHVIPVSKGGSNSDDNLVPACKKCNSKKGAR